MTSIDVMRQMLRHLLATPAYRGGKALRSAPPGYAEYRVAEGHALPLGSLGPTSRI
jgi:hypothetical protein